MRVMAVDYGDARTGVAISDALGMLAGFTTVIHSRKPDQVAQEIGKLVSEHRVEELVMGFPRNMDGRAVPGLCPAASGGDGDGGTPVGRAAHHH